MRPQAISRTGVGVTIPTVHDIFRNPFNVGIGCVITGTITYTVQHTFDNVLDTTITPTWFNHDDAVLVNAIANQNSNYAYPVFASRVNVTAGTGSIVATFIQAGLMGG